MSATPTTVTAAHAPRLCDSSQVLKRMNRAQNFLSLDFLAISLHTLDFRSKGKILLHSWTCFQRCVPRYPLTTRTLKLTPQQPNEEVLQMHWPRESTESADVHNE